MMDRSPSQYCPLLPSNGFKLQNSSDERELGSSNNLP